MELKDIRQAKTRDRQPVILERIGKALTFPRSLTIERCRSLIAAQEPPIGNRKNLGVDGVKRLAWIDDVSPLGLRVILQER